MNGSVEMIGGFVGGLEPVPGVDLALVPPAVYLTSLKEALGETPVALGVQDVHAETAGAFTGDIAAVMAAELGAVCAIVGHSERRAYHGEDDAAVADKLKAALEAGLQPIVCVGESLDEREAGRAEETVGAQLARVVERAGAPMLERAVVAYEPIWAIGTGVTATPEQAEDMHGVIRTRLGREGVAADGITMLYGGSVNADNALTLFAGENIDGALVGGASLKSDSFLAIARALRAAKLGS